MKAEKWLFKKCIILYFVSFRYKMDIKLWRLKFIEIVICQPLKHTYMHPDKHATIPYYLYKYSIIFVYKSILKELKA